MSFIERILNPRDCNALKAVSLPAPGPFSLTVKVFKPCSWAFVAAVSAASWAAYGVDFLEPLKPLDPADDHAITFPLLSAIETIVLLKVAFTKAIPVEIFFFVFFLTTLGFSTSLDLSTFFSFSLSFSFFQSCS